MNGTLQPPHYEKGDYIDFDPMNMWHIQEHVLKNGKKIKRNIKGEQVIFMKVVIALHWPNF